MKKTAWLLAGILLLVLAVVTVACGGGAAPTTPAPAPKPAPAPAPTPAPAPAPAPTPAPAPAPAPTTGAPPKAPKALHESLFAATPPGCTGCHTVGADGAGRPGGTGLPGPSAGAGKDHTGRTSEMCKGCHQLGS